MPDSTAPPEASPPPASTDSGLPNPARENIEAVASLREHEEAKVSHAQQLIERASHFFGSPRYLAIAATFIVLWVVVNLLGFGAGWAYVDEPPFFWLQGIVSVNALLLTIAVLIRQNRMSTLAEHRSHLDLQINLLTEQKVTKILQLLDELRGSGEPGPRQDAEAEAVVEELRKPADPEAMLQEIRRQHDDRAER